MADTTSRILRLLSLLQAHRSWSGRELMRRLDVSERTLRRDVDRLRQLGYPVRASTGPTGGYQLEAGADMPPLLLDDEEAVAIAIGLRTAAGGTVRGMEETSLRALAKLEQVLPTHVRRRVNMVMSMVTPVMRPWVTVDAEILTTVAQACRDHERIRFPYQNREGEESERNVEPHHLVPVASRWYLLAFDRDRQDWRIFRLDRVGPPFLTRVIFDPRPVPGGDAAEYVTSSLASRPMRYHVEVSVWAEIADLELYQGEVAEPLAGGGSLLRLDGDSLEWLAFRILWMGHDFEVHVPVELVEYLATLKERLGRAVPV